MKNYRFIFFIIYYEHFSILFLKRKIKSNYYIFLNLKKVILSNEIDFKKDWSFLLFLFFLNCNFRKMKLLNLIISKSIISNRY